jgi:hypothetical protein
VAFLTPAAAVPAAAVPAAAVPAVRSCMERASTRRST